MHGCAGRRCHLARCLFCDAVIFHSGFCVQHRILLPFPTWPLKQSHVSHQAWRKLDISGIPVRWSFNCIKERTLLHQWSTDIKVLIDVSHLLRQLIMILTWIEAWHLTDMGEIIKIIPFLCCRYRNMRLHDDQTIAYSPAMVQMGGFALYNSRTYNPCTLSPPLWVTTCVLFFWRLLVKLYIFYLKICFNITTIIVIIVIIISIVIIMIITIIVTVIIFSFFVFSAPRSSSLLVSVLCFLSCFQVR